LKQTIRIILALCCLGLNVTHAQTVTTTNWHDAGLRISKPTWINTVNVLDYGADSSGVLPCDSAFKKALIALTGKSGNILFPKGTFLFNNTIQINRDSITIKGAGYDSTKLVFNLAGASKNCIDVVGSIQYADTSRLSTTASRNANTVNVYSASKFAIGDWVMIGMNDSAYFYSSWAYGSLVQLLRINNISGNTISFESPLRCTYPISQKPKITQLAVRTTIGIECLKLMRMDATASQTSNINFDKVVNAWIEGIESDSCNFAHIGLSRCSNIEVNNSYIHQAFAYGGGGQGYGIAVQDGTGECKIEGNIFVHLRHSILMQSGANGNVAAYNYSKDPYWTEPFLPSNSSGDLVLHGNYPYLNLFEGNINQNAVIDNSHGINGPFNTFFRNRSETYGVFMNSGPATDSIQILGHEVTNSILGLYTLVGNGRVEYANNVKGTTTPSGTSALSINSLYLTSGSKPNCPDAYSIFPCINYPNAFNAGSIAAKDRYTRGKMAICSCEIIPTKIEESHQSSFTTQVYPNPCQQEFYLSGLPAQNIKLKVYNTLGQCILNEDQNSRAAIITTNWANGIYWLIVQYGNQIERLKIVKQ
jgi:hypothetical protein